MLPKTSVWSRAQTIQLSVANEIEPGFNIGFDRKIPEATKSELLTFVEWVERNFRIPITFWVDFDYKHYLFRRDGKRVGYLFYWSDFASYPVFNHPADIPELRLAVRQEHWTIEEILTSFIEAIMCYYAWICNEIDDSYEPNEAEVEKNFKNTCTPENRWIDMSVTKFNDSPEFVEIAIFSQSRTVIQIGIAVLLVF